VDGGNLKSRRVHGQGATEKSKSLAVVMAVHVVFVFPAGYNHERPRSQMA
jgi:flagellar basal body L-ring protein FlgH